MKKSTETNLKNSGAWQVFAIGPTGLWTGFRAPLNRLRQFTLLLSVLLVLCACSFSGWLLSRWRSENLARSLSSERLRVRALEQELRAPLANSQSSVPVAGQISFLPSLANEDLRSSLVEIKNFSVALNSEKSDFSIDFEIHRDKTLQHSANYYWIALLHSPKGILVFPSVMNSQRGEILPYKRGEFLENVQEKKIVTARFIIGDAYKDAGPQTVFASIYIYNDLGSLLVTQRKELSIR